MSKSAQVAEGYAKVVAALSAQRGVTVGGKEKKGFGASALRIGDKIFAMVSSKDVFVVKLPKARVDELVASGRGRRFDPGHGRIMKEWIELSLDIKPSWIDYAIEAKKFVSGNE